MRETLERLLAPIWRRLRLIVSRGVVRRTDDALPLEVLQADLLAGETALMERFQEYGFCSRPLPGAEVIAAAVGGARGHLVGVATDDRRHRPRDLEAGETCLYTDEGDEIRLKRGRIIAVTAGARLHVTAPDVQVDCETAQVAAATAVTLDSPTVTVTGQLVVQGGMAVSGGTGASVEGDLDVTQGDVTADGTSLKTHIHDGDSGGETGPPK